MDDHEARVLAHVTDPDNKPLTLKAMAKRFRVPEDEYPTLGCNVLAVRPGVVVVAEGNPATRRALEAAGVEVHATPLREVGENGSGGVTCLTRPLLREA